MKYLIAFFLICLVISVIVAMIKGVCNFITAPARFFYNDCQASIVGVGWFYFLCILGLVRFFEGHGIVNLCLGIAVLGGGGILLDLEIVSARKAYCRKWLRNCGFAKLTDWHGFARTPKLLTYNSVLDSDEETPAAEIWGDYIVYKQNDYFPCYYHPNVYKAGFSAEEVLDVVNQVVPKFNQEYSQDFLRYLTESGRLFRAKLSYCNYNVLTDPEGKQKPGIMEVGADIDGYWVYITNDYLNRCQAQLEKLAFSPMVGFMNSLPSDMLNSYMLDENKCWEFLDRVLRLLVARGTADAIPLEHGLEYGDVMYRAKNPAPDAVAVRREINLDDEMLESSMLALFVSKHMAKN